MNKKQLIIAALAVLVITLLSPTTWAANVKITPLGSHDGEFCANDRALIFEDPNGTRILYDAGRTVRGPKDPRLGKIDVVLLSHVHRDHLGDKHQAKANAGTCAAPDFSVDVTPNSNTVDIVVAKKATFLLGGEMAGFFAKKVKSVGGNPQQVKVLRFGAHTDIDGVSFASVPAVHSNGLSPVFLGKEQAKALEANGLTAYVGPPGGYVVTFSNGLTVYLSGDTGITADQELVVSGFYKPQLTVMNIGGTYTTGPKEAAYVINKLVRPNAVIASHANEAATKNGKLQPGTRTAIFKQTVKVPAHIPLSGQTMAFNRNGKCVDGCRTGNR